MTDEMAWAIIWLSGLLLMIAAKVEVDRTAIRWFCVFVIGGLIAVRWG